MVKQEMYDTGNPEIKRRACELRALGYDVKVSSLGMQVTSVGLVKTTMITVWDADERYPSPNKDHYSLGI